MTTDTTFKRVQSLLSKQLQVPVDAIKLQSLVSDELGADSLDVAEIAMMIQEEFGYDLTDAEWAAIKTVEDMVVVLNSSNITKL